MDDTVGIVILYVAIAAAHFSELSIVPEAEYVPLAFTTLYSGCIVTLLLAIPPVAPIEFRVVKPLPGENAPNPLPPCLASMPIAAIRTSSGCNVMAVGPVLSEVPLFPVAVDVSKAGDTRPLNEKNVIAQLTLVIGEVATMMVPLDNAVVTGAEKIRLRMPVMPEPLVTSAFFLYMLPALSVICTSGDVGVPPSIVIVTNIVRPTAAVTPVCVKLFSSWLLACVPAGFPAPAATGLIAMTVKVPAGPVRAFPALSVAVACTV